METLNFCGLLPSDKMVKRKDITLTEKNEIIKKFEALPNCSQRKAALILGIPQSTLSRILKQRSQIIEDNALIGNTNRKRKRVGKAADVEAALLDWYKIEKLKNVPISRSMLVTKAKEFAINFGINNFTATDGWLSRWIDRHNVEYTKKLTNRKSDVHVSESDVWKKEILPKVLENYKPEQIFILTETALYYRALPDHILFKSDPHSGNDSTRARITIALICNITGTVKMKPLIIGQIQNPRCLKSVKQLPVEYCSNINAWMSSKICTDFLSKWDNDLGAKKIVLILNKCPAHPVLELKNIKPIFLPGDISATFLSQDIVKNLKINYRKSLVVQIVDAIDDPTKSSASDIAKSISLLDTIHMLVNAWDCVTPATIFNCFKSSRIFKSTLVLYNIPVTTDIPEEIEQHSDEFLQWVDIDESIPTSAEKAEDDFLLSINTPVQDTSVSSEEDEDQSTPSAEESRKALQIIRKTLEQKGATCEDYLLYYKIEKRIFELINTKQ